MKGLRVEWEFKKQSGTTAYTMLYINGVPVGVEHTTTSSTYVVVSDDIIDIFVGDLIQIFAKGIPVITQYYVRNMKIKYMEFINNDP